MTYWGQQELQFQKPYVKLGLSNAPQPPTRTPRSVSRNYISSLSALLVPHSFHLRSQKQLFGARSQRRHNRQPDACAVGPRLNPRLWRQRQRPAPSALATVLTGTRSGYFFRIFSPSERRFSNGCSSLYTNFILPGTGLDLAGLREPGGGAGTGGGGDGSDARADSAERSPDLRHFPIHQPRPRPTGASQAAMIRHWRNCPNSSSAAPPTDLLSHAVSVIALESICKLRRRRRKDGCLLLSSEITENPLPDFPPREVMMKRTKRW